MLVQSGYGSIHAPPAGWRTKTLWRAGGAAEFDSRLGRPAVCGRLCSDSLRRVTVAEPRPFPRFPASREEGDRDWAVVVRARTPQWLGWFTKKWPHVWRDRRECSVVWSSGEARALTGVVSGARRGRANPARGWIGTAASIEGVRK